MPRLGDDARPLPAGRGAPVHLEEGQGAAPADLRADSRAWAWAAITSGFAEVDGTRCVVLVDSCTRASAVDAGAVESAKAEADGQLSSLPDDEANAGERARLEGVVARAELELDVASR